MEEVSPVMSPSLALLIEGIVPFETSTAMSDSCKMRKPPKG